MIKRKTAGERIAFKHFPATSSVINTQEDIAADIDRAIRRAQANAYDEGYGRAQNDADAGGWTATNPYRGRAKR